MNSRVVIVLLFLAGVLAAITVHLTGRPAGVVAAGIAAGERVASFDVSALKAIRITRGGGGAGGGVVETLARVEGGDAWTVTGANKRVFALSGERINGFIRLLTQLRAIADAPATVVPDWEAQSTLVEIIDQSGGVLGLRVATRTIGGQCVVEVITKPSGTSGTGAAVPSGERRLAVVSDELNRVLISSALSWRQDLLIAQSVGEATRIELSSEVAGVGAAGSTTVKLTLGKVQSRWRVLEPVVAPADSAAVNRLLNLVQGLRIVHFFDDGAPGVEVSGLDRPQARLTVELPSRGGGETDRPQTITILIGASTDPTGKGIFAAVTDKVTAQTAVVAIDPTGMGGLKMDPSLYVSGIASTVPASDVGMLVLSNFAREKPIKLEFARTIDGWVERTPAAAGAATGGTGEMAQDPTRVKEILAVIELCCKVPAQSVKVAVIPGYEPIGKIELRTAGGDPLDEIELGRLSGIRGLVMKSKAIAATTSGGADVYRVYDAAPELLVRALGIEAGGAKASPAPRVAVPDANK